MLGSVMVLVAVFALWGGVRKLISHLGPSPSRLAYLELLRGRRDATEKEYWESLTATDRANEAAEFMAELRRQRPDAGTHDP